MEQLITIDTDGSVVGLDFKKRGVDLRQFGHASIQRSSEILWDEEEQGWYINLLRVGSDPEMEMTVSVEEWRDAGLKDAPNGLKTTNNVHPLQEHPWGDIMAPPPYIFAEYDDAVAAEIQIIQAFRTTIGVDYIK